MQMPGSIGYMYWRRVGGTVAELQMQAEQIQPIGRTLRLTSNRDSPVIISLLMDAKYYTIPLRSA